MVICVTVAVVTVLPAAAILRLSRSKGRHRRLRSSKHLSRASQDRRRPVFRDRLAAAFHRRPARPCRPCLLASRPTKSVCEIHRADAERAKQQSEAAEIRLTSRLNSSSWRNRCRSRN